MTNTKRRGSFALLLLLLPSLGQAGIDDSINDAFRPVASALVEFVSFTVAVGETQVPLLVVWLIAGAIYFTVRLKLINVRGFRHAVRIVAGREDRTPKAPGEVTHFQALTTAVSGTVGVGTVPGGMLAVLVLGFRRAAFSNEAGIGSSAIVHAAVKTREPVTQGFVAMLEPFIDTVVICTITALVIVLTVYDPAMLNDGTASGVELTSSAFASVLPWFPCVLAVVVMLFAYSTMVSCSYYGMEGFVYIFGPKRWAEYTFNGIYCLFVIVGCTTQLDAVLDFSGAMIFAMALANVTGLYLLLPVVRRELDDYWRRLDRTT